MRNTYIYTETKKLIKKYGTRDDYNMLLANKSQPVRVLDKISPYEGVALEIDKDGALLVRVQSGEIRKVCSGEVSVRGLYSYI